MLRFALLAAVAMPLAPASPAVAQDLQPRPVPPPPPSSVPAPAPAAPATGGQQIRFSANDLQYDSDADVVTVTGDVRMYRAGDRLRADKVVWNRKTGKVIATGNVATTNPAGDVAYGDSAELTDTLRAGVIENALLVLDQGGRLAARQATRDENGRVDLHQAAYTPCAVETSTGCPKRPSWKITAVRIVYRPDLQRVSFSGGHFHLFGLPAIPLPALSEPVGGQSAGGLLTPDIQYSHVNGLELVVPYYVNLAPDRGLTVTPHIFSSVLPMLQASYRQLNSLGAFQVTGYATVSRRSDDLNTIDPTDTEEAFRGYIDGVGHFQLSPEWSLSGSLRLVTDPTFLRRYDISRDDRLRTTLSLEHIDADSYFAINGWAVQTLRVGDDQGMQPVALPEIDYRRRWLIGPPGGVLQVQLNSLALGRKDGQDTQRAFASAEYDLRRLTPLGQEVSLTAYGRLDAYNTDDELDTEVVPYRGLGGFHGRAIGALAADVRWPFVGTLWGGTQRLTPRLQIVAAPKIANLEVPNEDSRAVDLDDSNLFALNRFPGYDRFEDSSRVTYGAEWAYDGPGIRIDAVAGQSYRLGTRPTILPDGTGLADRFSDIVGRTEIRFRDLVSITHRYRLDKDSLEFRRNEIDATIGSRSSYLLVGYLRLNRNIDPTLEDLEDHEELRLAARVQFRRFWSLFGSTIINLTDRAEDPLSLSDGFDPVRHRIGVQYEDDCLRLGLSWKRDYEDTGDARAGNRYLLSLAFKNLGR